jgi:hypothetical protein
MSRELQPIPIGISVRLGRGLAVLLLGVLVPCVVLFQAYVGLTAANETVSRQLTATSPAQVFVGAAPSLRTANDYALFSFLSAEKTNQSVMLNKQVMKLSVMQLGFAVASLGMMFVVLGIRDGAVTAGGEVAAVKFDLRTGSTGLVVFLVGAGMAAAGGILSNEYRTVPTPNYIENGRISFSGAGDSDQVRQYYDECTEQAKASAAECFYNTYRHYVLKGGAP